jgi:hypothetical protein
VDRSRRAWLAALELPPTPRAIIDDCCGLLDALATPIGRLEREISALAKPDSEDVTGEDVRRGHPGGLTRSPTDQWVSCLGSVGHAGWPRRARTEQAP